MFFTDSSWFGDRIIVGTGDITSLEVDAVVNAANSSLLGGGGVDGAIHSAGGPSILAECRALRAGELRDGLPTGEAVSTTAGTMLAGRVIHTVGPRWTGGRSGEPELLASAYRNSLTVATREGLTTVAFPSVSTGIYGFPKEVAAPIVWSVVHDYLTTHDIPHQVYLVFYALTDMKIFLLNKGEPRVS